MNPHFDPVFRFVAMFSEKQRRTFSHIALGENLYGLEKISALLK